VAIGVQGGVQNVPGTGGLNGKVRIERKGGGGCDSPFKPR
jgi:hypothetical protein